MASISGLGSGLDVESIISQLMAVERLPENRFNTIKNAASAAQTAWGNIGTTMSALLTNAKASDTADKALGALATSSSPSRITATAATGAPPTSLDVIVSRLATAQQQVSRGQSSTTTLVGAGSAVVAGGLAAHGLTSVTDDGTAAAGRHTVTVTQSSTPAVAQGVGPPTLAPPEPRTVIVQSSNGTSRTVVLQPSYVDAEAVLADLQAGLGDVAAVTIVDGMMLLTSRDEGSGAELTISGGALSALGLTGGTTSGTDGKLSIDGGAEQTVSHLDGAGSLSEGGLTVALGSGLRAGTATALVVHTSATTTLADLASQLSVAGGPVAASAIDTRDGTGTPARLVLSATATGSGGALTITSNLAALTGLSTSNEASDAELVVSGLTVTRSSNTINDLVPGVTLQLLQADPAAHTAVSVGQDSTSAVTRAKSLVDGLNAVLSTITTASRRDLTAGTAGPLAGEPVARALSSAMLSAVTGSAEDSTALSRIGLSVSRSGTWSLDETKLSAALSGDPAGTAAALAGLGNRIKGAVETATGSSGPLALAKTAAGKEITAQERLIETMDVRLQATEERYRRQYTALDVSMQQSSSMAARLAAQLGTHY